MGMKGKRSQDKWINTLIRYVFRAGRLTWHEGNIPPSEVWLKIGGDKGGGTFKMNFRLSMLPHQTQCITRVCLAALRLVIASPICIWHLTALKTRLNICME